MLTEGNVKLRFLECMGLEHVWNKKICINNSKYKILVYNTKNSRFSFNENMFVLLYDLCFLNYNRVEKLEWSLLTFMQLREVIEFLRQITEITSSKESVSLFALLLWHLELNLIICIYIYLYFFLYVHFKYKLEGSPLDNRPFTD